MRDQERILAVIRKGSRNAVFLTSTANGQRLDLRQHEPNGKRELIATFKGIGNLDLTAACEIAHAILRFAGEVRS